MNKIAPSVILTAAVCSLTGCIVSIPQSAEVNYNKELTISGFVANKKYPIKLSCRNEALAQPVYLTTVMPSETPFLTDKRGIKAFAFSATLKIPYSCLDSGGDAGAEASYFYNTIDPVQVVTRGNGVSYETNQQIYLTDQHSASCFQSSFSRTHSFAQAFLDGCYAAFNGVPARSLFTHSAPIGSTSWPVGQ